MPSRQIMLGRRIRARRILLGLQQQELADLTGMPQEHISRFERGTFVSINPDRLAALAIALKTTTDYLLGLSDDETTEGEAAELASFAG